MRPWFGDTLFLGRGGFGKKGFLGGSPTNDHFRSLFGPKRGRFWGGPDPQKGSSRAPSAGVNENWGSKQGGVWRGVFFSRFFAGFWKFWGSGAKMGKGTTPSGGHVKGLAPKNGVFRVLNNVIWETRCLGGLF